MARNFSGHICHNKNWWKRTPLPSAMVSLESVPLYIVNKEEEKKHGFWWASLDNTVTDMKLLGVINTRQNDAPSTNRNMHKPFDTLSVSLKMMTDLHIKIQKKREQTPFIFFYFVVHVFTSRVHKILYVHFLSRVPFIFNKYMIHVFRISTDFGTC